MLLHKALDSLHSWSVAVRFALFASLALASACTIRPFYSDVPLSSGVPLGTATQLATINIKQVNTRYGQEVRNHLIFMFNGAKGQQAAAPYQMDLAVAALNEAALLAHVTSKVDEPTAGMMTLTGTYAIIDIKTGKRIAGGKRSVSASHDWPRQEFAKLRAQRDAENRAARELAELLMLAIVQDMSKS